MSEASLGEALERMVFDAYGRVLPCFYYDPLSASFVGPETLQPAVNDLFTKLKAPLDTTIKKATGAVYRCFALDSNKAISHTFTGFFIAPNVLATSAHNLYSETGSSFNSFIACLIQGYATPFRAFEKYSELTILHQPALRVQTEPQKQRGAQGPDFALLRTADYFNLSWIYPIVHSPSVGENIVTLQFNAKLSDDFLERHKHIQHEQLSKDKIESILYTHRLSSSAGPIVACNEFFVSYSATSAPGASGGPVFSGSFEGFSAIHRGTLFEQTGTEKIYDPEVGNFGARVTQPEFGQAYHQYVVPELVKKGPLNALVVNFLNHFNFPIPHSKANDDDELPPVSF